MQPPKYPAFIRCFSSILFTTFLYSGLAQNLVPNYSFETVSPCPSAPGTWGPTVAPPWVGPTLGTPDIFHVCGSGPAGVPSNFAGTQSPNTGEGYAGIYVRAQNGEYREYILAPLLESLEANAHYLLSFYISMGDVGCASQLVGAYVSEDAPHSGSSSGHLDVTPQLETNQGWLTESEGWIYVSGCFIAEGGEQFITLGNFHPDSETPILEPCFNGISYYYIDDVVLEKISGDGNLPLELGGPEFACLSYTIDPGLQGYNYIWEDGSHDPTLTVTESGVYGLTIVDGCSFAIDSIEITIHGEHPVDLGPDAIFCDGESYTISLDPTFNEYEWNDGSTDPEYTITSAGTYAVTLDDGCSLSTDEITVEVLTIPESFDLGEDVYLCYDTELELSFDPTLGDFLWQDMSTSSTYVIYQEGTYSLTISNQCGSASDAIIVTGLESPEVNIGPDTLELCSGEVIEINIDPGPGDIFWQDGSGDSPYLITSPGTYHVLVSNICGTATDEMEVFVVETPFVDFGPDVDICPGEQTILHAGNPGANILWQDGTTLDSLIVSASGIYTVIVSNSCHMVTDTIVISMNGAPPQVNLPDQITLCHGQTAILDAGITGVAYIWNDNSTGQQLAVSSPGTYSITASNGCGTDQDTIVVADGGPAPTVSLGNDVAICAGDMLALTPVFANVTSWQWHDGSVISTYMINSPGEISVAVSNSCGSAYDTLNVSLLTATPPLDLGADTALCSGESFVLSINTPGITIEWPDGSSDTNYNVSESGLVYATITNSCGTSYDTIQVNALPDVPALNLGVDQSLCPGEIISVSPGISNVQYLWQDGSTGNSYQSTQEETIILTISNDCGSSTDTIEVTESTQGPQLDLGSDIQVCSGETVTIQSGTSGVNYAWQDGSTGPDFTTTQSGVFILDVNNNCGSATDTIVVDISGVPPTPVLPADTTLCEGMTLILTSTADAETTIEWQNGSSANTLTVTAAGVYTLSESNRCGDDADTITVTYLDAPDPFTLGSDTTLCPGETLTLNAPSIPYTIMWQDGSDETTLVANQAGTYSLQISNECGTESDELVLDYDTRLPLLNLAPSISWCPGDIFTVDATQPFPATYSWSTGATSSSIQIVTPGVYTIEVATPCSTVSMDVDVFPGTDCIEPEVHNNIYIPNIFSPNDDGINDKFALSFGSDLQVTAMTGSIFDRWGNLVYGSDAIPFEWNGFFADEAMMPGVYVYRITCTYIAGNTNVEKVFAGDVTLLK